MKMCFKSVVVYNNLSHDVWLGGRVMTNSNIMYHVKHIIADFDACSLYPSVMYVMTCCLEGLPKVLTNLSYDFLKSQDGYLF